MVQSERMRYLLAHHMLTLVRIVVSSRIEVGIVHLGRALGNMAAAEIDRRQAQPASASIASVADLGGTSDHRAAGVGFASNDSCQKRRVAGIPVAGRPR